jgi:signal transduction histidine kinase
LTFRTRLLLATLAVLVAALGTAVLAGDRWLRSSSTNTLAEESERSARLVALLLPRDPGRVQGAVRQLGRLIGRRVTVVDSVGVVVADSDFDELSLRLLDNHADRVEIAAAMATGTGRATRFSTSTQQVELKVAIRAWPGVVRVAVPLRLIDQTAADARRVAWLAILAGLTVGTGLAIAGGRAVAQPLRQLSVAARTLAGGGTPVYPTSTAPEIRHLVHAFRAMQEDLDERLTTMQRAREETETIFDSMVEGVVATDPEGRVVACNRAARRLFAYGPDQPLPNARELFRAPDAREVVDRVLAGRAVLGREMEIDDRVLLVTARPLPATGAVICLHDVTAVRRLEAVRRDFVANVSHELKTPLTSIAGYAETLRGGDVDAETQRKFLDVIVSNAQRMQRLVDDLLDLARIEAGAWRPQLADVDPAETAEGAWAAFADRARDRGVAFRLEAKAIRRVQVDPDALRQILTNLFDNALRYTPTGGTITFATRRVDDGIELSVTDTGSGIPAEHLPRVFERFYRVDPGRSRDQGGTGLGLSIVRHLVESHGGRVDLESAMGAGTTVRVVLPPGTRSA